MTDRTHPDSGRTTGGIVEMLQDRVAELEAQIEAIGAGGVSPLIGQPQAMPDLSQLTERGAKAWAGVDAQGLREGFTADDMATASAQGFRDGVASLPLQGAQEAVAPHGWLYDWTHSSATGRPDETYTSFTKDEQHARKHDNCTPVYAAPQPALSAGWVSVNERLPEPNVEVLCAGRGWGNSFVTACYYDDERREWYPINTHWTDATGCAQYPTHWMPLPPSPSKDGEING